MQSRDYLKKQFEQISKAIAQSLANLLKIKFDSIEKSQFIAEKLDPDVLKIINLNLSDFETQIKDLPVEALQNLSLLLIEISINEENKEKISIINIILSSKHKTLDFNYYLRNS